MNSSMRFRHHRMIYGGDGNGDIDDRNRLIHRLSHNAYYSSPNSERKHARILDLKSNYVTQIA